MRLLHCQCFHGLQIYSTHILVWISNTDTDICNIKQIQTVILYTSPESFCTFSLIAFEFTLSDLHSLLIIKWSATQSHEISDSFNSSATDYSLSVWVYLFHWIVLFSVRCKWTGCVITEPVEQSVHIMRTYLARPFTLCRFICYRITEVNPLHRQFTPSCSCTANKLCVKYLWCTLTIKNGWTN